jgi:hypothetical protein
MGLHPNRIGRVIFGVLCGDSPSRQIHVPAGQRPHDAPSYHAPPGVNWGLVKPRQANTCASWLATQAGPMLFGADANTPLVDAIDFADTRTHWHTGDRHLQGEPGDDRLWGPAKVHALDDALRRWLSERADTNAALRQTAPHGPLAITHRTGRRKNSAGTARRFDSVWISHHWRMREIQHLYDEGLAAGSARAAWRMSRQFSVPSVTRPPCCLPTSKMPAGQSGNCSGSSRSD